jgi:hypothetical protein
VIHEPWLVSWRWNADVLIGCGRGRDCQSRQLIAMCISKIEDSVQEVSAHPNVVTKSNR